jgi:hypothetical protein
MVYVDKSRNRSLSWNRNLLKVGTGTVKNSYCSATLLKGWVAVFLENEYLLPRARVSQAMLQLRVQKPRK